MSLRRKPPADNVRRVAAIGENLRSSFPSKTGRTIQCESFAEMIFVLLLDGDPSVKDYRSQPETFHFFDKEGKAHKYVPDFMVERVDGTIEIHEVTCSERQDRVGIIQREEAAREICQKRGWSYSVHTEKTLPNETEVANLLFLSQFRPLAYANDQITSEVNKHLQQQGGSLLFIELIKLVANQLDLPELRVRATICHLLWHGTLATDNKALIIRKGKVTPSLRISLAKVESRKQ